MVTMAKGTTASNGRRMESPSIGETIMVVEEAAMGVTGVDKMEYAAVDTIATTNNYNNNSGRGGCGNN